MNKYVFYNSVTGKIYSVRKYRNDAMAHNNCSRAPNKFNMVCEKESVLGIVHNADTHKVNVSAVPHVVERLPDIVEDTAYKWRQIRNKKLLACDWTQGADSPLSEAKKTEWATYRQALRDFDYHSKTETHGVTWPTKPS